MILQLLLIYVGASALVCGTLYIIGSGWYDIDRSKQLKAVRQHPYSKPLRRRPQVSAIVYGSDHAAALLTAKSLLKSSYRKLEVIVPRSNWPPDLEPTKRLKQYKASITKSADIKRAYKLCGYGDIILTVAAGSLIHRQGISRAVSRYNQNSSLDILLTNRQAQRTQMLSRLFQDLYLLIINCVRRANSAFNSDYFADFQSAVFYRIELFNRLPAKDIGTPLLLKHGDRRVQQEYADEIMIFEMSAGWRIWCSNLLGRQHQKFTTLISALNLLTNRRNPNHSVFLVWFRYPLALLLSLNVLVLPLLAAYLVYMAVVLQEPDLLLALSATLAIYLLSAIIESNLQLLDKIRYMVLLPVSYVMLCLVAFTQLLFPFSRIRTVVSDVSQLLRRERFLAAK